jgi:hypothetical protein
VQFLAFLERRVESQRRGRRYFAIGLYPWTGTRSRGGRRKGRRLVLSCAPQCRDRSLPATVNRRAGSGSLGAENFRMSRNRKRSCDRRSAGACPVCWRHSSRNIAKPCRIVDLHEGKLKDLAQQSGITAENAAVRVHRARAALRRRIEQACGTCSVHGCLDCSCEASTGSKCGG